MLSTHEPVAKAFFSAIADVVATVLQVLAVNYPPYSVRFYYRSQASTSRAILDCNTTNDELEHGLHALVKSDC